MNNSSPSSKKQSHELHYLGAFALGMVFIWLSVHAGIALSASHPGLNYVVNSLIGAGIYGLGAAGLVYFAAGRKIWPALICGLAALVIAPLLALVVSRLLISLRTDSKSAFGIVSFVAYIIFGALYSGLLALGRRIGLFRRRTFDAPTDIVHNK
ncbi:MAG: hypothetical protein NVSMB39_5480 [Candidatus Saccharimonadales bacterium]